MKPYRMIDHTADIGIEVFGEELSELYVNAAFALFDLMLDLSPVRAEREIKFQVEGMDPEDLMVEWLRVLLGAFHVDGMVFKEFKVHSVGTEKLEASAYGEGLDMARHTLEMEIKAVTYHGLRIEKHNGLWSCRLIFDI